MEYMPSLEQNLVNQGKRECFPFTIRISGGMRVLVYLLSRESHRNSGELVLSLYRDFLSNFEILVCLFYKLFVRKLVFLLVAVFAQGLSGGSLCYTTQFPRTVGKSDSNLVLFSGNF